MQMFFQILCKSHNSKISETSRLHGIVSSGMIGALGAPGPAFDSPLSPLIYLLGHQHDPFACSAACRCLCTTLGRFQSHLHGLHLCNVIV